MDSGRDEVVASLDRLLADSYVLQVKTQSYHWNVTGPMFTTLHGLFELQYAELAGAIDEIAERVRALGAPALGSLAQFMGLSHVQDDTTIPTANDMIRNLLADQELMINTARAVAQAADSAKDAASHDLAVRRIEAHERNAWILRSHDERLSR